MEQSGINVRHTICSRHDILAHVSLFYQELIVMFEVRLPNKCFKSVVLAMDSGTESSFCMNTHTGGKTDSSNLYNAVVQ